MKNTKENQINHVFIIKYAICNCLWCSVAAVGSPGPSRAGKKSRISLPWKRTYFLSRSTICDLGGDLEPFLGPMLAHLGCARSIYNPKTYYIGWTYSVSKLRICIAAHALCMSLLHIFSTYPSRLVVFWFRSDRQTLVCKCVSISPP